MGASFPILHIISIIIYHVHDQIPLSLSCPIHFPYRFHLSCPFTCNMMIVKSHFLTVVKPRPGTSMETSSSSAMRGELWTSWDERRTGEKWLEKKIGRKWDVHGKIDGLLSDFHGKNHGNWLITEWFSMDFSMDIHRIFRFFHGWWWILMGAAQEPLRKLPQTPGGWWDRASRWGPLGTIAPDGKL
jgi:hypothetical protein